MAKGCSLALSDTAKRTASQNSSGNSGADMVGFSSSIIVSNLHFPFQRLLETLAYILCANEMLRLLTKY